jgi:uncharacterized protein (DUF2147 family)
MTSIDNITSKIKWHIATRATISLGLLAFIAGIQPASADPAHLALGVWADEDGKSHIEIAPCGEYLCGHVVWLKEPEDASGQPKTDINNPDKSLRSRPILGLKIIGGLQPDWGNTRLKGQVYNAEDGRVYDFYLKPKAWTMSVEGCFLMILCGSQTWTRVR